MSQWHPTTQAGWQLMWLSKQRMYWLGWGVENIYRGCVKMLPKSHVLTGIWERGLLFKI